MEKDTVKAIYGYIKTQAELLELESRERKAYASYLWVKELNNDETETQDKREYVIKLRVQIIDAKKKFEVKEAKIRALKIKNLEWVTNEYFPLPTRNEATHKSFHKTISEREAENRETYGFYGVTNSASTRRNKQSKMHRKG